MPTTWQFVAGEAHGGAGGAVVQHGSFCSAVALSTATAVVQEGSTVHGGHAGDDPADDPAHAGDVLVALPVAELEAAGQVGVAAQRAAAAAGPVAARLAEGEAAAAPVVARAGRIAVHVVAGAAAVRGVVRHPPAAHDGVLGAEVGAADRAAELGEPRAARAAAAAAGVAALADRAVGGAGLEGEVQAGADGHGAADEGGPVDQAAPRQAALEDAAPCASTSAVEKLTSGRRRTRAGSRAARAASRAARAERARAVSQSPTALTKSSGNPAQGWWASCGTQRAAAGGRRGDDGRGDGQREVDAPGAARWAACRAGRSSRRWPAARRAAGRTATTPTKRE